jgi:hypothetical protein
LRGVRERGALGFCGLEPGTTPWRPHAIGRADAAGGALGSRVLTRPEDRSLAPVPNRWQPSADARCAILRRPGVVPARPRAELASAMSIPAESLVTKVRSARCKSEVLLVCEYQLS